MVAAMKVIFRADASLQIGSGHVMRCLTLAEALRAQGAECQFICRAHPGNLISHIRSKSFKVHELRAAAVDEDTRNSNAAGRPTHAHWLGIAWELDAKECEQILNLYQPDWLIVDHYGLDALWEQQLKSGYRKLLVIDDLADRPHRCDVLLDQNLGHCVEDYAALVPRLCKLFAGARYALLRPEFTEWREKSLQRRASPSLKRIIITMGGVDQPNATGQVLETLRNCPLPADSQITVVMGSTAPWLEEVRANTGSMPWPTEILVNISDMAQRMAQSDLAIGAAGSTSWERCCLGLPTLMVTLAQNQVEGAAALHAAGGALLVGDVSEIKSNLGSMIEASMSPGALRRMSDAARLICDGSGVASLVSYLRQFNG